MKKEHNLQNAKTQALNIPVVRRSICCNSEVYYAPAYYNTTMKTNDGKDIPLDTVCLKCGCRCSVRLF